MNAAIDHDLPPVSGTRDRYDEVSAKIDATDQPVLWGQFSNSNVAGARVYSLARSPHNDDYHLQFAQRAMRDGVYVFAYKTDAQHALLDITMTYSEWRRIRGIN